MKQLSDKVRYSRAGDQFHYRWAARRCLALLDSSSELDCITIEGISSIETPDNKAETGEEVVDVAEYYGGRSFETASKITYLQLKHSYSEKPWTLSALKKTFAGFFKRFQEVLAKNSNSITIEMGFVYVTNREAAQDVKDFFHRIRSGVLRTSDKKKWQQILGYMKVNDEKIAKEFLKCFRIEDSNDIHWKQRNILIQELKGYIAGHDKDVADQLWRLVTEKALPEQSKTPEITREDVLRYLNTDEQELYPAQCKIEIKSDLFQREQEEEILSNILKSDGAPIIIHADGGVGKTALAVNLFKRTPTNSFAILYDCFGNGEYRSQIHRRDLHSVALVQISNELAKKGLSHPLIPSSLASSRDYITGFVYRLEQAIKILKSDSPEAKLLLYIDAADNSQMAAEENGERACFAKDIIRECSPSARMGLIW